MDAFLYWWIMMAFVVLLNIFMQLFFVKMFLLRWIGFWFVITYNSGIIVLLLYMRRMCFFEKRKSKCFVWCCLSMDMFLYFKKYFVVNKQVINCEETHFFILHMKNFALKKEWRAFCLGIIEKWFAFMFLYSKKTVDYLFYGEWFCFVDVILKKE